jgi:hypothetical protein
MTDNDQVNRELAGKLGICWHEHMLDPRKILIKNNTMYCWKCDKWLPVNMDETYSFKYLPNFFTAEGRIELLRRMMEREDWYRFLLRVDDGILTIFLKTYILDDSGMLARAALGWFERE